jgi:catechol 2,3-dioxygenase-like lactoylglutathione lyase family enzyme
MSMITLGVDDLGRSIDFYEAGLGFPRHGDGNEVAFFSLNGTWLGLYGRAALAEDAQVSSEGNGFNFFTIAHNVASEDEVNRVMEQAVLAGATVTKEPQKASWGGYSGHFKDPDGHLWEVAHNPYTWIGPVDDTEP